MRAQNTHLETAEIASCYIFPSAYKTASSYTFSLGIRGILANEEQTLILFVLCHSVRDLLCVCIHHFQLTTQGQVLLSGLLELILQVCQTCQNLFHDLDKH